MRPPILASRLMALIATICLSQPSVLARETLADPETRQSIESIAENIAAAIYELDYLNPNLAPFLIEETVANVLENKQLDPAAQAYLQEILNTWFSTLPNINSAIGPALEHISLQTVTDTPEETMIDTIETASIRPGRGTGFISHRPRNPRGLVPRPPRTGNRDNSGYDY